MEGVMNYPSEKRVQQKEKIYIYLLVYNCGLDLLPECGYNPCEN
jgi:hypothetical protein